MENITLISYIDSRDERKDGSSIIETLKSLLLSISCTVKLISKSDYLDNRLKQKGQSSTRASKAPCLHLFDKASLNNSQLTDKVQQRINGSIGTLNFCLIKEDNVKVKEDKVKENGDDDYRNFYRLFDDLFFWPCDFHELKMRLRRIGFGEKENNETTNLPLADEFKFYNLVGYTETFLNVLSMIKRIAKFDAPVFLQGETGTGKENAARAIHCLSNRASHGFIPINCATLPDELFESELFGHTKGAFTDAKSDQEGLVEIAKGGTLFLDEVDSLSTKAQAALLRFLQTQEYRKVGSKQFSQGDVRIIAASNANFEDLMASRQFRSDLFFRLNVVNISIPPLRERVSDILPIANSLIEKLSMEYGCAAKRLSHNAIKWLKAQPWQGNVRELENVLLRKMLLDSSPVIEFDFTQTNSSKKSEISFPFIEELGFQEAKQKVVQAFEKQYLESLLLRTDGNVSEASRICGKERSAIGKMLKKYNIRREQFVL